VLLSRHDVCFRGDQYHLMKLGKATQSLYNWLRLNKVVSTVCNFVETREREFRHAREKAVQKALALSKGEGSKDFTTRAGIFTGLRWPRMIYVGSVFAPKILGTYELEIQAIFAKLAGETKASFFIDIGAAEGYFAVGAALINPQLKIIAFEQQQAAHEHIRELATLNSVSERIEICGEFDLSALKDRDLGERPLVLMDVEGAEATLIDESFANRFADASLIVEVHDFASPGVSRAVKKVLSRTHEVTEVHRGRSTRKAMRSGTGLSEFEWRIATDERRPPGNHWLVARPLNAF
jgi:predicted RNA methylase